MKETTRQWFKAKLLPAAHAIFTPSFYPEPKKRTGSQYVYFSQVGEDLSQQKVIVASKFETTSLRIMTLDLALKCLLPKAKASKDEAMKLNEISLKLKV